MHVVAWGGRFEKKAFDKLSMSLFQKCASVVLVGQKENIKIFKVDLRRKY